MMESFDEIKDTELLSVREVARFLEYSERHIYWLIENKDLPAIQLSERKILIPKEELNTWIKDNNKLSG